MSSSDSEDDCYGNVARTLHKMKNKYEGDRAEASTVLNLSDDTEKTVKTIDLSVDTTSTSPQKTVEDCQESVSTDLTDEQIVDQIIASSKRFTRASLKKVGIAISNINPTNRQSRSGNRGKKGRGRGKKTTFTDYFDTDTANSPTTNASTLNRNTTNSTRTPRGGRGRRRGNRRTISSVDPSLPIYSVGNTAEYYDQSDNLALFSGRQNKENSDVAIVDDTDPLEDNEELSVKVYWQSSEFFKFPIRKFQKLTPIYNFFSHRENVGNDKLLFTYRDKILKEDDTPDSIDYNIGKFIDGGIVNQSVSSIIPKNVERKNKKGIQIKFQCQNAKKPFNLMIGLDEKLSIAMMKYAEHLEKPLSMLKFEFDGDSISGKKTARELELEGGECIDVKIIS